MANQKDITLRQGDASPNDVVLYDLPIADVSAGTTIYLVAGDATAKDVILRDPTVQPGGYTPITITGTLAATEAQDIAALSGVLVHVGTLAATEAQDSASLTGKIDHTGTLDATEAQDTASFTGTVPSHETPAVSSGGGGGKSKASRPTRLLVTLNGKDHVITVDQLPGFLEYAKTQIDPKPVKVKKKKGKKRLVIEQEAPQIIIKSVPQYALPEVRKVIDRTNEIMAILWERALMAYINELEDEEALILALTL